MAFTVMCGTPRTVVVTGGSAGIGLSLVEKLTSSGAKVIAICRSPPRRPVSCEIVHADFNSLLSVREAMMETVALVEGGVDALVCNAGIMATPPGRTRDGFEQQFGVNHLAHTAVIDALLPHIRERNGRIVLVSSLAAAIAGNVQVARDSVLDEGSYGRWRAYGRSKLANAMAAKAVDAQEKDVTAVSVHPGLVQQTEIIRYLSPWLANVISTSSPATQARALRFGSFPGMATPGQGAERILNLLDREDISGGELYRHGLPISSWMRPLEQIEDCETLLDDTRELLQAYWADQKL